MATTTSQLKRTVEETPVATVRRKASWSYYCYCEMLKILRDPSVIIFGIGFPGMFFLIFGSVYAQYETTLLAQYAAYGAFVVSFQTFSISVATERSQGWNKLLRTTPINVVLYLGSKFLIVMLTTIISFLVLCAVAVLVGNVHMALSTWLTLFGLMVVGMIPFAFAGLFLGFIGSSSLSQIISIVVTLLLSFTSGLFIPLQFMPAFIRNLAPYLPTYHLGQIAWYAVGSTWSRDSSPLWLHLIILAAFAIAFALLAAWAYIRDENENFG